MTTTDIIPFEKEAVRDYLDTAIRNWRERRTHSEQQNMKEMDLIASCYVDAFQSVRSSLFGEVLPPNA